MKIKKSKLYIFLTIILVVVLVSALFLLLKSNSTKPEEEVEKMNTIVKMETNMGTIKIELYDEQMPITTQNFKNLVEKGYYDGIIFHRIIDGFMIQGGDPSGTGSGGPGYKIKDEFTGTELDQNNRGTISMANAGPNTGGSQFFINLVNNNYLDGKHPVFGKVIEGMDVVDAIAKVQTGPGDKPIEDVVMEKVTIEK